MKRLNDRDKKQYGRLETALDEFSGTKLALPGIENQRAKNVFILQLIDSVRRVQYVYTSASRNLTAATADPKCDCFDPVKAAIYFRNTEQRDEAFWMVFLAIHFGKAANSGWQLARDVYGALGEQDCWSWKVTSKDPEAFVEWLRNSYESLVNDGVVRKFGNHRKYESLKPDSNKGTGSVIRSYIEWIGDTNSHDLFVEGLSREIGTDDPRELFHALYISMDQVMRFGRTGKFDYLTMLGKLQLLTIEPGMTYMKEATGPKFGARLLFSGRKDSDVSVSDLENYCVDLESYLPVGNMGMQVIEDALCNWQKHPLRYRYFNG